MEYFHKKERIQVGFYMYLYLFLKKIKMETETETETETEVGAHLFLSYFRYNIGVAFSKCYLIHVTLIMSQ